ncbi:MAG: radical SAM/SPASM domain-containing protein [Lentisphaeria bacterium]|nr:radical SAM/SPASM domain-containing protein [Lentisphaeria bacterium]
MAAGKRFKHVYVEVTNRCNLTCAFCPTSSRPPDEMSVDVFARIIAQLVPLCEAVCLHVLGEPLRHARFPELIGICARLGVPVVVTTNGTLLTPSAVQALLHPGVRQVNVSLHGLAEAGDSAWRQAKLTGILAFAGRALRERPDLFVNLRLWNARGHAKPSPDDAWNATVRSAIESQFGVVIPGAQAWGRRKGRRLTGQLYLHRDTVFEWPALSGPVLTERGFCHGLGTHFGILADGTVVPCCLDHAGVMALGNCREKPVADILSSPRAMAILNGFHTNRIVEPLCRRCLFRTRFGCRPAADGRVPEPPPLEKRLG